MAEVYGEGGEVAAQFVHARALVGRRVVRRVRLQGNRLRVRCVWERGGACSVYLHGRHPRLRLLPRHFLRQAVDLVAERERERESVSNAATASRGSFGAQVARLHCFLDAEHASVALHLHLHSRYKGE